MNKEQFNVYQDSMKLKGKEWEKTEGLKFLKKSFKIIYQKIFLQML